MAQRTSTSSSEGYADEPVYTQQEFERLQQDNRDELFEDVRRTRPGNWCKCDNCRPSPNMKLVECVCCKDDGTDDNPDAGEAVRSLLVEEDPNAPRRGPFSCVVQHPAFWAICLYKRNLQNEAHRYEHQYGDRLRFRNENRKLRYLAYREFVRWCFGRLGRHIRKVIPACVVRSIRVAFPKNANEEYEGFHYADNYDPDGGDV